MIALHWYMGTAEEFAQYWETLEDMGFLLALPQSSQVVSEGGFGWDNGDLARKELFAHREALRRAYAFDEGHVILAWASQGGRLAIELAFEGSPSPPAGSSPWPQPSATPRDWRSWPNPQPNGD